MRTSPPASRRSAAKPRAARPLAAHLLLPLCVAVLLGGCQHRPRAPEPLLREGRTEEIGPHLTNYGQAVLPRGGTITVWSDDLVPSAAPPDRKRAKTISFAAALAAATGLRVDDQSRPGETISGALKRLPATPVGDLVVLAFGYGDAAASTPPAAFAAALRDLVAAAHARGAPVLILTEPLPFVPPPKPAKPGVTPKPGPAQILSGQVDGFNAILRQDAGGLGAGVIDAPPVLTAGGFPPSPGQTRPKAAVALLARAVSAYIEVAPPASPKDGR